MQGSMEIEPQDGTAGTGGFSREGYAELLRVHMEKKEEVRSLYQKDFVGMFSELRYYFDIEMAESREERKKLGELEEFLDGGEYSFKTKNAILCITNEYGVAAEESGFRRGFQTAMRLCMEGMRGGAC